MSARAAKAVIEAVKNKVIEVRANAANHAFSDLNNFLYCNIKAVYNNKSKA